METEQPKKTSVASVKFLVSTWLASALHQCLYIHFKRSVCVGYYVSGMSLSSHVTWHMTGHTLSRKGIFFLDVLI